MIFTRDIIRFSNVFYLYNVEQCAWKKLDKAPGFRTSSGDLSGEIELNKCKKIITFSGSPVTFDTKGGVIRRIIRTDYVSIKCNRLFWFSELKKANLVVKMESILSSLITKKDIEKIRDSLTVALSGRGKRMIDFFPRSKNMLKFLTDVFEQYCHHMYIDQSGKVKYINEIPFLPLFVVVENKNGNINRIAQYFMMKNVTVLVYHRSGIEFSNVKESSYRATIRGKIKSNYDKLGDIKTVCSMFVRYIINNICDKYH